MAKQAQLNDDKILKLEIGRKEKKKDRKREREIDGVVTNYKVP